ncbi:hypothetical protein [Mesorhizobium norvegicum]|nr:hypothetical protein [Mesorhizobium norvegicum]
MSAVARRWGINRGFLSAWRQQAGLVRRKGCKQGDVRAAVCADHDCR